MRIWTSTVLIAVAVMGTVRPSSAQTAGAADETIQQAVAALAAKDDGTLSKLSIEQTEFKKYIWPALAVQMTGTNTNADKYYPTYQKVSQVGITEANTTLAGKKWEVVKVSLEPAQRKGKGFQVFGPPTVTIRDETGQEKTVKIVGGLLERDGAYKVTTYYVSPSQRAAK
ncbi:MAG TPA: hypothetical protein VFC10_06665 [Terriglobia bacterium]|nr:hypothetical protein [Terriglobia bacterium]